jgi:hypothetical protein
MLVGDSALGGNGLHGMSLDIFNAASRRLMAEPYDKRIMSNLMRPAYVEFMIAVILGDGWRLVSADWAGWDLENDRGARIEVKQSAARQTWTDRASLGGRATRGIFDIKVRRGYWREGGFEYVELDGRRAADVFIFAWHPFEALEHADHRDAAQWHFYIVPEGRLPPQQKTIGLTAVRQLAEQCSAENIAEGICAALGNLTGLKVDLERLTETG